MGLIGPPTVPGDYNNNGIVDAADFTVWRDTLGSMADLRANGDNTGASVGVVDQADYDFWKLHFGETLGGGSASFAPVDSSGANHAAVPEPSTLWLLMGCVTVPLLAHRRWEPRTGPRSTS
jgi:hypothetical protein